MKRSSPAANIFAGFTAIITWFALSLQLKLLIDNSVANNLTTLQSISRFFSYFTILTNLLVAICLTSILIIPRSSTGKFFQRPSTAAAIAVYIFIVGLIYNILLRPLWNPQGCQKLADELLHVVVPVLYILYWLLFAGKNNLRWKLAFKWLLYSLIYLIYMLIRGSVEGFYPYPFLDVNILGYSKMFLNAGGMLLVFVIINFAFIAIGRLLQKKL